MANRVTPIHHLRVVDHNRFRLRKDLGFLKTRKLFSRRDVEESVSSSGLYRQVFIIIICSQLVGLWPLKKNFRICFVQLVLSAVAISIWTYYSLSYGTNNIDVLKVATARYTITFSRLFFCCMSVISTIYLHTYLRSSYFSFFRHMARVDSILRSVGCQVPYPANKSFLFHALLTFHLIYIQTNYFSRLGFLLEVKNQYRYCVFIPIQLFCVLLNALAIRFHLVCTLTKNCRADSQYRLHTLINVHKSLCQQTRKLRKIYSFQILMIFAVIIITYIWNMQRFFSMILRFEDEYAKRRAIDVKSRTVMISLYTYWLWLMANAGENLKRTANRFYEELYSVILDDDTNTLSRDLMLKTYLKVRLLAEYRLCKTIHLDNRIIKTVFGITVSYIIISIQLSIPCKCK